MTLSPWIIGSEKGNKIIKEFLDYYEERSFYNENGVSAIMIHTKKGKKLLDSKREEWELFRQGVDGVLSGGASALA